MTRTTRSLEAVLLVPPAVGRWFLDDEAVPGGPAVVVLSHGLWMRRYGGDQAIVGQTVVLDGTPMTVVGIMPPSFAFPDSQVQAWLPRQDRRQTVFDDFSYNGVARVRTDVTVLEVRAELSGLIAGLPEIYPENPGAAAIANRLKLASVARTLKDAKVGRITQLLFVLLASVGFVLLVAGANAANLFLVRADARHAEIAIRRSLGAGGREAAGYFAAESALIAVMGGALGGRRICHPRYKTVSRCVERAGGPSRCG